RSFSSLTRKGGPGGDASTSATLPAPGGMDEPAIAEEEPVHAYDPRFAGPQFGVAMHTALERVDFAKWREWLPGEPAPGDEAATIAGALREQGYTDDLLDDGIALVTSLVGRTLRVVLPEGVQLCNVPGESRRPELEFQFPLRPTRVDALLQLLHAHDVVPDRHSFGFRQRLEGLKIGRASWRER